MGGSCNDRTPTLRIVLGAFGNSSEHGPSSASTAAATAGESPAAYILGTSYFAAPRLGVTGNRRSALKLNKDGRVPMEDRKGPFDHFRPKSLVLSTLRVTTINISTTLSNYFSDQLCYEQKIEEMVDSGDITPVEADQKTEEWESQEWQLRMNALPKKIGHALIRFHSCTALMRFYELIMARYVLRVDGDVGRDLFVPGAATSKGNSSNFSQERAIDIMDKLTRDPFQAALRTSQILHNQEHANGKVISSTNGTETTTSREIATRMFSTCIWANIIPFLAELTVQQGVLMYGYGAYYMAKHKRRKKHEAIEAGESKCDELDKHEEAAYALSLFFRSCHLTVARSASWLVASAGGAAGSVILPGWGTVLGIQIGDAFAGALFD
ncbi:hypothetical protein ACHAXA_007539 [Cyclostephanos tholiformis]|uniref:Uncharacterized protein n=1 Tax=Cyclostephanos tholiformis TaxID=382380 RepID=A0ABD3SS23_9STRA